MLNLPTVIILITCIWIAVHRWANKPRRIVRVKKELYEPWEDQLN